MADNFSSCLSFVLQAEGGWAFNPRDPGGCTMFGITLPSYRDWLHDSTLTCSNLHVTTSEKVHDFYLEMFWQKTEAQQLPLGVDLMVMDAAVNMGVSRSIKILQNQVKVLDDGVIGPLTLAATINIEPVVLIDDLAISQIAFYRSLDNCSIFGNGWINRVHARRQTAIEMLSIS